MIRWQRLWLALFVVPFVATLATAQEPKPGKPYKNENFGFELKAPEKWDSVGAEPNEKNLIVKFDPATQKQILLGTDPKDKRPVGLDLHFWIVKFDHRQAADADGAPDKIELGRAAKDLKAWMPFNVGSNLKIDGTPKESVINKIPVTYTEYVSSKDPDALAYRVGAYVFKFDKDLEIALVCNGHGDPRKWQKYSGGLGDIARSFRRLKDDGKPDEVVDTSKLTFREKRRLEIEQKLKDTPAWKLYVTDNYFIISSNTDKAFIEELMARAEAIHKIYEQDYPAAKAEEYKKLGESLKTGDQKKDDEGSAEARLAKAILGDADPRELAKCSVIRVCLDDDQYRSYGGSPGSAGYWNWTAQELVIYDDKKDGGRGNTWSVLNHEGFHQYIFYFFGNISPQSWYNEGTGDFYSGYQYNKNNKQFKLEKFDWRTPVIKEALQKGKAHDLAKLVRMTQPEYYDRTTVPGLDFPNVSLCYAQGWSFIYFLRTGKKNGAKNWDPKWDGILETYLKTLAMTGDVDQAVEAAFNGIDMNVLQESWAMYTK